MAQGILQIGNNCFKLSLEDAVRIGGQLAMAEQVSIGYKEFPPATSQTTLLVHLVPPTLISSLESADDHF